MFRALFVPIKDHSARVVNKNFIDFCGNPLWVHTLKRVIPLINDNTFDELYIDTDSEKISLEEACNRLGTNKITIRKRKPYLRGDLVSVNNILLDFVNDIDMDKNDVVCQFHTTSPFIDIDIIRKALDKLLSLDHVIDSIASCTLFQERIWREDNDGYIPVNHNPLSLKRTQDLSPMYVENSMFYMFFASTIREYKNRMGKDVSFYPIGFPARCDIDTEDQLKLCKLIMEGMVL